MFPQYSQMHADDLAFERNHVKGFERKNYRELLEMDSNRIFPINRIPKNIFKIY
jgi:hypothetical protein